ncbi:unnamed protein product, partial [Darwinula stevensoni]
MKRIAIIAGEVSGDLLAARLMLALRERYPECQFEGIAGAEMQAAGCQSLFPLEKLAVMGLVEVLKHLPELLAIRKQLFERWRDDPPDLFIEFVGHPLADEVEFDASRESARAALGLQQDARILALLPGSRRGEVQRLAPDFLRAALQLQQKYPDIHWVTPAASPALRLELESIRRQLTPDLSL